jgi:hypothetical protein
LFWGFGLGIFFFWWGGLLGGVVCDTVVLEGAELLGRSSVSEVVRGGRWQVRLLVGWVEFFRALLPALECWYRWMGCLIESLSWSVFDGSEGKAMLEMRVRLSGLRAGGRLKG